jgi:excisionase family DNA binding protein
MDTILLKIPEVMTRLAIGQTKLYELMATGELRSVRVGRSRRIPKDELERFIGDLDDSRPNMAIAREGSATRPNLVAARS